MASKKRKSHKPVSPPARSVEWRRLGRWLASLMLLVAVAGSSLWGVVKLRDPAVLPLKVVRIDGELKQLDRGDLERAVSGAIYGNFFTVDLESVRDAVRKLAWVDQVTVRRIWPATLSMWVTEQQPLAHWGDKALVNVRGDVFEPGEMELTGMLPQLEGPQERSVEVVEHYRALQQRLEPLQLHIRQLTMDDRGAWTIGFSDGVELKLGHEDTAARVARFIRLYPQLGRVQSRKLRRVDMRYANGVAVLWGEASPDSTASG